MGQSDSVRLLLLLPVSLTMNLREVSTLRSYMVFVVGTCMLRLPLLLLIPGIYCLSLFLLLFFFVRI